MANRWEKMETVADFIFLGSKVTVDSDCSHEIHRCLPLGRKAMIFPVVMYGCKSWNIKKAECQRIDAFELWSWRRLLRVPWTARRSNQSILKEIIPECSLEGLMLKLKLKLLILWPPDVRTNWLEKTLMLGKTEGWRRRSDRGWDDWKALLTQWTWVWANSGRQWRTWKPGMLQPKGSQRVGHDLVTEQQQFVDSYKVV